jgi:hypothetical protein
LGIVETIGVVGDAAAFVVFALLRRKTVLSVDS